VGCGTLGAHVIHPFVLARSTAGKSNQRRQH
jgi:hypothetical protein